MNREAWLAAVHGVAKSWTRLSEWTELNWTEFSYASHCLPVIVILSGVSTVCHWWYLNCLWNLLVFSFRTALLILFWIFSNCISCITRPPWGHWMTHFLFHYLLCSIVLIIYVQFSSVAQSCPTLCDPMNRSTPGLPVHHQLPEFTQTHIHRVSDAIQPSHPLSSPSPSAPNPSQHQSLFQWVNSSHEVAKVLEFQL